MTQIWAHRGSRRRAPENTIEAFALAIDEGADGIELDVHLTADGRLVVRHDPTVTVESAAVPLDQLDYASIVAACPEDARPPLLEEVYALVSPTSLVLNVEAKTGDARYDGIVDALVSTWRTSGMSERVVFSSFNHHTLVDMRKSADDAALAPLIGDGLIAPGEYVARHGFSAVHLFAPLAGVPGVLEDCASRGVAVRVWTVNAPHEVSMLAAAGVDAIITDDPLVARSSLSA